MTAKRQLLASNLRWPRLRAQTLETLAGLHRTAADLETVRSLNRLPTSARCEISKENPAASSHLRLLTGLSLGSPHSHPNFGIQTSLFPALTASHALSSQRRLRKFETLHAAADCWCLPDRRAVSGCTTQADPSRAWLLTLISSTNFCISLIQALPAHAWGTAARLHLPCETAAPTPWAGFHPHARFCHLADTAFP